MERPDDDAGWAEVLARWDDEDAHRAYLDAVSARGLDGLGEAGRRYRDVLAARPGDPRALGAREEILRRALVQGLAQLPRTPPPAARLGRLGRGAALALGMTLATGLGWLAFRVFGGGAP